MKNKRYDEAIDYYRLAVKIIEEDLNSIYKKDSFFFLQEVVISSSCESQSESIKKPLFTQSRRNREKSTRDRKKKTYSEKTINHFNESYSNRLFQLGLTLYTKYMIEEKSELTIGFLPDIIITFEKVIKIESFLGSNPARIIHSLIYLSNVYLEQGDHAASLKYLNEAESSVFLYEKAQKVCNFFDSYPILFENLISFRPLTKKWRIN